MYIYDKIIKVVTFLSIFGEKLLIFEKEQLTNFENLMKIFKMVLDSDFRNYSKLKFSKNYFESFGSSKKYLESPIFKNFCWIFYFEKAIFERSFQISNFRKIRRFSSLFRNFANQTFTLPLMFLKIFYLKSRHSLNTQNWRC